MVWEQRVCADIAEAATRAVDAGNDLVMTTPSFLEGAATAIADGRLQEARIDEAVRRILHPSDLIPGPVRFHPLP